MYFRFACALLLVVVISLAGAQIEKRNLELRRSITRQDFQRDVLREEYAQKRLQAQQLGTPERIMRMLEEGSIALREPASISSRGKMQTR